MVSRRDFLKTAALGLAGLAAGPAMRAWSRRHLAASPLPAALLQFPQAERLGRVLEDQAKLKARPADDSPDVAVLNQDDIVVWERELVGSRPMWFSQNYVQTPDGYLYAPNVQPVQNRPNQPLTSLPANTAGMWVEVTVPYVDLTLANPPARSPWLEYTPLPRLYYSQVMWMDQIKTDEQGHVLYHVLDRYGSFGDIFWAAGEAFRPLTSDDLSPIHPDVEGKLVKVNLNRQTLSCYEGKDEVYFCRVSTGGKFDSEGKPSDKWATPVGRHTIWRKLVSVHMTGGTTGGGYDLPGIGWTTLFSGRGMAIHSTFWHNGYGVPLSHGCVNTRPQDAQWIWRWTQPVPAAEPGDLTISGEGSTKVQVAEDE